MKKNKYKNIPACASKSAFTLLELLVVSGIIAFLVVAGTISYTTVQAKARDAKRKSDLKDIQNALEQYFSGCGLKYPISAPGDLVAGNILSCLSPPNTFITYPAGPLGGNYQCVGAASECDIDSYTICPPVVSGSQYLETEDCNTTNKSCCLKSQQ
ncbi:MAG: hypothetical protein ACD_24C00151G0004 [uncultured bacterium]|nr:MAG: hypothetical protein ACD_24C00151G0004 [uncultured bacterium]